MRHVAAGSPIAVHGDYDVDGVCSAAVLASTLRGPRGAHARAPAEPRRGLRPVGRARRGAARGRRPAADHDGLRHHRLRGGGARPRARHGHGRDRPSPPGRCAARVSGGPSRRSAATRPSCARPASPTSSPRPSTQAAERDVTELERELDLVALATVADLVPLRGREPRARQAGPARDRGHARGPGCAHCCGSLPSTRRASRSRRSASRSRRASTLPGACTAPTRRSSCVLHRRRRPRAPDRTRARRDQHRAPIGRDRDPVRGGAAADRAGSGGSGARRSALRARRTRDGIPA